MTIGVYALVARIVKLDDAISLIGKFMVGRFMGFITPLLINMIIGIISGALVLSSVNLINRLKMATS